MVDRWDIKKTQYAVAEGRDEVITDLGEEESAEVNNANFFLGCRQNKTAVCGKRMI